MGDKIEPLIKIEDLPISFQVKYLGKWELSIYLDMKSVSSNLIVSKYVLELLVISHNSYLFE